MRIRQKWFGFQGREEDEAKTARAAGVREHEDSLFVIHEGLRFGDVRGAGAVLDAIPIDAILTHAHDAPRAARDLCNLIGSKALHNLVESAQHGRQCRQVLDQLVTALHGLAALHRLAVTDDRTR